MPTFMAPFHSFVRCVHNIIEYKFAYACTKVVKGGTCSSNTKVGWFCKFTYLATSLVF